MPIELNHTIVHARDPQASADFLAEGHYLEIITRPYGSGA